MLNNLMVVSVSGDEEVIQVPASDVPESEISVEISSEPLYCLCQEPWDIHNRKFMIHCDHCSDWFHGTCVGITEDEAKDVEKYHCPKCVPQVGSSVLVDPSVKKIRKRKMSLRCTPEFIEKLKAQKFLIPDEVVLKVRGQAVTLPWLISKGFTRPMLIESVEGLGIKIPPENFTVRDVERYVGSERMVDVIDVERQSDLLMSMQEFADYFTSPNRSRLLNLISLEFSHTSLSKLVEGPAIARKLDWVTNYWPTSQSPMDEDTIQRPAVQKYCLISAKDSYTDFHVDFGGTSVWYHVLWGEKVFYLIEPSEHNLNLYYRWMEGEMGDTCFLPDEIPVCFRCVVKKGNTLLIPTGWIHAVYTPVDSLVFGGNFLSSLNMDLQLKVYEIEKRLHTPSKYLFPSFEAAHWYAADGLIQELQTLNATSYVPSYMINGLKALIQALRVWFNEKDVGKVRREYIPVAVNCKKIIHHLCKELRAAEKRLASTSAHRELPSPFIKERDFATIEPKLREVIRRDSAIENGCSASSREGSPVSGASKDSIKHLVSRASTSQEVPSVSPVSSSCGGGLKLKIKRQSHGGYTSSGEDSQLQSPVGSPPEVKEPRVKIRLSLSEGKAESIDCDSIGSDALHIVESDHGVMESDGSSKEMVIDLNHHKSRKHHKKCKKLKLSKLKHDKEQTKAIDDEMAGTLEDLERLFESSNFQERISQSEASQAVKDAVVGMSEMKDGILPGKKKSKHRKRKHADSDSIEGVQKVHQDDDYIYFPLAGSDDEASPKKSKRGRGRKQEEDDNWSPRAKVGPIGQREAKSARVGARREAIEKGLEDAAATLDENGKSKKKRKKETIEKVKKPKLLPTSEPVGPSTSAATSSMDIATKTSILAKKFAAVSAANLAKEAKRPKKGCATAKQRLGKILKIKKYARVTGVLTWSQVENTRPYARVRRPDDPESDDSDDWDWDV